MKKLLVLLLLLPLVAEADTGTMAPMQRCVNAVDSTGSIALVSSTMASSRTFSLTKDAISGGFDLLVLKFKLVDGDSSITRFDVTCTGGDSGAGVTTGLAADTTAYTPQECTVASGTATCLDSGVWQKATPGTKNWAYRLNTSGFANISCTLAVGTGSGAAADTIAVTGRWCTR